MTSMSPSARRKAGRYNLSAMRSFYRDNRLRHNPQAETAVENHQGEHRVLADKRLAIISKVSPRDCVCNDDCDDVADDNECNLHVPEDFEIKRGVADFIVSRPEQIPTFAERIGDKVQNSLSFDYEYALVVSKFVCNRDREQ